MISRAAPAPASHPYLARKGIQPHGVREFGMTAMANAVALHGGFIPYVATFLNGARDLIGVALVVAVARGIYVVMEQGVIIDTILHWAEGLVSGLSSSVFILMAYLVHIILSFFIPSTSGLATVSMPLMGPLADFSGISRDLVITAYQSASGWINLFAPTAAHLVAGLALARIPYDRFVRWVLPFIIGVALITMGVLVAGTLLHG